MMILYSVILNEVKNLEVSVAVDSSASLEILRYTQDDIESEEIAVCCQSERSDESPQSRPATTHIDSV